LAGEASKTIAVAAAHMTLRIYLSVWQKKNNNHRDYRDGRAETLTRIRSLGNHYSERSNSVFIAVYKSDTSSNSVLIVQLFLLKPASLPSPPEQT
jgi:hypothetical protein